MADDFERYVLARLNLPTLRSKLDRARDSRFVSHLVGLAKGNADFLSVAMDALDRGDLTFEEASGLTLGFEDLYSRIFSRLFSNPSEYERQHRVVLSVFVAAKAPLAARVLRWSLSVPGTVRRVTEALRPYLNYAYSGSEVCYSFRYNSLRRWLGEQHSAKRYWVDEYEGHRQLSHGLIAKWKKDRYALLYLPDHLMASCEWDVLFSLLSNLEFLEAKARAASIYGVLADLVSALAAVPVDRPERPELVALHRAIDLEGHTLGSDTSILAQEIHNRLVWAFGTETALGRSVRRVPTRFHKTLWCRRVGNPRRSECPAMLRTLLVPGDCTWSLAFSPDGKELVCGSRSSVFCWDVATGRPMGSARVPTDDCLKGVIYSPDGNRLACLSGKQIALIDAHSGRLEQVLEEPEFWMISAAFSPDGTTLAVANGRQLRLWNLATGTILSTLSSERPSLDAVAYSSDGCLIAAGGGTRERDTCFGEVSIWRPDSGVMLKSFRLQMPNSSNCEVKPVLFTGNGETVAGGSTRGVACWHVESGKEAVRLNQDGYVKSFSFCLKDRVVAVADLSGNSITLWDRDSGAQRSSLNAHTSWIDAIACSPDGLLLASVADDEIVVWNLSAVKELADMNRGNDRG